MRFTPFLALLVGALTLNGCTRVHQAQAPVAITYPYSEQQRMQAAHHWQVLARHEASGILKSRRVRFKSLHLPTAETDREGVFARGFRDLLTSQLVSRGANVTTLPGLSAEVHVKVERVRHRDRAYQRPPVGAFTALASGIGVVNLALEQWSAPAVKLIPMGAVAADLTSGNWTYTGKEEVIITTQVIDDGSILYSSSNLYYINAGDRDHYDPQSIARPEPVHTLNVNDRW